MAKKWDVVVVGAGPGGSTAAFGMAMAGLRVVLLEKEKIPRYKPCGGALSTKVPNALRFDFSPAVEDTIRQVSIACGAERFRMDSASAWCVMRDKFDALLSSRAAEAGAELRDAQAVTRVDFEDGRVTVFTEHEAIETDIVVGADGANGIVRRAAGLPAHRRLAVALEAEMQVPSEAVEAWRGVLHLDFGAIPWGYAWIFPKAEHLSVGIGALMRPGHKLDLHRDLARYAAGEPSLRGATATLTRGHRLPLGGERSRYHAGRAVLVGDAAGLVDPFTAEGIYYAIRSGQIAAEEVVRASERGDGDLSAYTRHIHSEITSDFQYGWNLTQVFYRMPHLAYHLFARSATAQNGAARLADGALTYRELPWRVANGLAWSLLGR